MDNEVENEILLPPFDEELLELEQEQTPSQPLDNKIVEPVKSSRIIKPITVEHKAILSPDLRESQKNLAPVASGTNDLIYYKSEPKIEAKSLLAVPTTLLAPTSMMHSLSWRQEQLVKKSLAENNMYERALHITNAQIGFPLYPIYANERDKALFQAAAMKNDYFSYMLQSANSFGEEWKKDEKKDMEMKISEKWRLGVGNPFHILSFGPVLGTTKKRHPTRTMSVREIKIKLNSVFFHIPKRLNKLTEQDAVADIFTRPVVSETVWRKFVSTASAKYSPAIVRQMIDSMIEPSKLLTSNIGQSILKSNEIASILSSAENVELRQLYDELRTSLLSTSNPAYVGSFITSLLGRASALDWCPLFTKVFETVNGRSTTIDQDSRDIGVWEQITISQMTKCFYRDVLIMHKELDAEMLLANLFQIVFGLDWAQSHIGFVHGNLDARGALRYTPVKNDVYLFYNWRGKYYRIPSYGRIMKLAIPSMEKSTIYVDGVKHASSRASDFKLPGSHLDLLRLGATLRVVLLDRTAKIKGPSKGVITLLSKMLDSWSTCINEPGKTNTQGAQIDTLFLREKCIDETAEVGQCTWSSFVDIPKDLSCPKAIPSNQQKFFKMFELSNVRDIPKNALIYTLA